MRQGHIPSLYAAYIQPFLPRVRVAKVPVRRGTWQARLFGALAQSAVTWASVIHLTDKVNDWLGIDREKTLRLYAHECFHVWQQQEMSWLRFLVVYGWHGLWNIGKPASRHPMERPAYAFEERVVEEWDKMHRATHTT